MINKQSLWMAAFLSVSFFTSPAFAQEGGSGPEAATAPAPEFVLSEAPEDRVIGSSTAPITMIIYASVTCPHCGDWFSNEWPEIKKDLVESGKLRVVFRPFPTAPQQLSMVGFVIAECAKDEAYFDVIEYQMENQESIFEQSKAGKGREAYLKVAESAGLDDEEELEACLTDQSNVEPIHLSAARAQAGKIRGVPAFFINGDIYSGPQEAQALVKLIDEMNDKGLSALPKDLP